MERTDREKQQGQDHAQPQAERQAERQDKVHSPGNLDLGNVAIHPNGNNGATASEQAFGAQAFTQGQDVHFPAGEHAPGQQDGKQLLAHEATHTVQQNNNNRE